jgi:high-affinity iron transporter
MFANYLIGLREGLEATLVVSILIAYLVQMERRDRLKPVWLGVALAIILSVSFGAALTFTSAQLSFEQQEIFGGVASIIAVGFVTWMIFWMRRTARTLRHDLDGKMAAALQVGAAALVTTAFLAVAREGLETALFFWSAAQASSSTIQPLLGFGLGIATAVVLGWLLYRRAITLNLQRFFTWTGAGLILVAAGVLAYGLHDLQEAGVLPGLGNLAFDVSTQVPADSWYGTLLKGVFNFSPQTTVLQAIAWSLYVGIVMTLFLRGNGFIARLRGGATQAGSAAAVLLVLLVGGCGNDSTASTDGLNVTAKDNSCDVNKGEIAAGTHSVAVENKGSKVNEVYVYAVGNRIMGEVENVTPGIKRSFKVTLTPGAYELACKPGMVGDGIRQPLKVTGKPVRLSENAQLAEGVASYRRYVLGQAVELQRETARFTAALRSGDLDKAKSLYSDTRRHYERIEPIAESFLDLDVKIDIREGGNPKGTEWTGFHRIEKALWQSGDVKEAARFADRLDTDVAALRNRLKKTKVEPEQLANGARQLMDEVATGKITGEEERYSRTDLADFQANLEGAEAAYTSLRPIVVKRDPQLARLVDQRFERVETALNKYRAGDEFVTYDKLGKQDLRSLATVVDGLSEPLSRVSGVVLR